MTRTRHDLFAKQYLATLLKDLGEVFSSRKVVSETREIDLLFIPSAATQAQRSQLDLFGKMISRPSLFESYRNPVTRDEINTSIGKLYSFREELIQEANRKQRLLQEQDIPQLWILSPTVSQRILQEFKATPEPFWTKGIYNLSEEMRVRIVAIQHLPRRQETIWLRIMGRGKVLWGAIAQLRDLPQEDRLRQQIIEHLSLSKTEGDPGKVIVIQKLVDGWRQLPANYCTHHS